jgi:very-short-patch-repair endonuclease
LLQRTLEELATRGRPGIRLMRELAEARPASYQPAGSNTEARVNEILQRAGERPLRQQVDIGSQTNWVGRIDLVDDQLPLSIEAQSELFHGSKLDRERDRERIAALRSAGHEVVEVWETDVWCRPQKVLAEIRDARRRATRRRAA